MNGYLGETILDIHKTKYAMFSQQDWILFFIERWNFDGEHHKAWLIDQITRLVHGTKVIVSVASWSNGESEERFALDSPSQAYLNWLLLNPEQDLGVAP